MINFFTIRRVIFYLFLGMAILFISCSPEESHTPSPEEGHTPDSKTNNSSHAQIKDIKPPIYQNGWKAPGPDYKWVPSWIKDQQQMNVPRGSPAVIAVNGYIYVMGGGFSEGRKKAIHSSVEYTKTKHDGSLSPWKMTSPMNTKRVFASAVHINGYIYVLGGEKGYKQKDLLETVEKSKILPDNSLGPWEFVNSMSTPRRGLVASSFEGRIYAFGGYNGNFLTDIVQTKVNPDGSLQKWEWRSEDTKNARYIHSGLINKKNIYLFGGHVRSPEVGTDAVEWNTIQANGDLGAWKELSPMPTGRVGGDAVAINEEIYVIGGQNTINLSAVDKASILPDGRLGKWSQDTPLIESRVGVSIVAEKEVLYVIGGFSKGEYKNEVLRAYYSSGHPLGIWSKDPQLIASINNNQKMPIDAGIHFNIGWKKFTEKKYDEAILELKLGLKVKSNLYEPHNLLGGAYSKKNMYNDALHHYKEAIRIAPKIGALYTNIGNTFYDMGNIVKSEEMYRKAIILDPKLTGTKISLYNILAKTNRCSEAQKGIEALAAVKLNNPRLQAVKKLCSIGLAQQ